MIRTSPSEYFSSYFEMQRDFIQFKEYTSYNQPKLAYCFKSFVLGSPSCINIHIFAIEICEMPRSKSFPELFQKFSMS